MNQGHSCNNLYSFISTQSIRKLISLSGPQLDLLPHLSLLPDMEIHLSVDTKNISSCNKPLHSLYKKLKQPLVAGICPLTSIWVVEDHQLSVGLSDLVLVGSGTGGPSRVQHY